MDLIGKSTIHPIIFFSGKIAGYIAYVLFALEGINLLTLQKIVFPHQSIISLVLLILGAIVVILSLLHLGKSTRLGIPSEATVFKTNGIYRFSRNPMYVGFHIITIAAILYTGNYFVFLLGMYSFVVYHFIILGEEAFLEGRFEEKYTSYKKQIRRYL